jgi:hypothetical protein
MDLQQEFKAIIASYGHNIYLYRRSTNVGSGPYMDVDEKYLSPLEKWTIYRSPLGVGRTASSDGFMRLDEEGYVSDFDTCFYFLPEADVKTSDIILEDTPNQISKRQAFRVMKAIPYYLGNTLIYIAAYSNKTMPTER